MSKKYFDDVCDDPECVFCQDDDGDAAFWDEFYYSNERLEEAVHDKRRTLPHSEDYEDDEIKNEVVMSVPFPVEKVD